MILCSTKYSQESIFYDKPNYALWIMIILHCTYRSFNREIGIMLVIIKSMLLLLYLNILCCHMIKLYIIRT